ncbi:helix-turn-helix transcriptional regulator [Cupriavidus necator]
MEYAFTLKFHLSQADRDTDALVERLAEAGCDDALVGTGLPGRVALAFVREAESARVAMVSALADARRAMPSATLIEAAPDLVGLTDIAEMVGVSRQNMRKLMLGYPDSFPVPVHEGSSSLWHLLDVIVWLGQRGYDIKPELLEIAATAMQVNLAKCASQVAPAMAREFRSLVA